MENPLAKYNHITVYDDTINEEVLITPINIGKYFRNVYFLCPLGSIDMTNITELLKPTIILEEFNNYMNQMVLFCC
jgi:hypothetical protein